MFVDRSLVILTNNFVFKNRLGSLCHPFHIVVSVSALHLLLKAVVVLCLDKTLSNLSFAPLGVVLK